MKLIKQYLIQSLTAASNNLRLTTHQLESLGLLKECILKSEDVKHDISRMKAITELSTLGIKLNDIYNYLAEDKVDFFKISEKFKSHSQHLINDLNHLLEIDNPSLIKNAIEKIKSNSENADNLSTTNEEDVNQSEVYSNTQDSSFLNEEPVSNVEEDTGLFNNYESVILKPIKPIDTLLKKLDNNEINYEDLSRFAEIMKMNSEISEKNGFEMLSQMHNILCRALLLIKSRDFLPDKNVIESMRSCLIVIVAVVKGKDVDITNYLKKAEDFEKEINSVKIRV